MTPDWTALAPHRPLEPGSKQYVEPPWSAGAEIANRVIAGAQTILVGGPAGIGKSTELARAAALLRGKGNRIACLAPIDVWENMRRLTPDQLLLRIAGRVAFIASHTLNLPLNNDLLGALVQAGVLTSAVLTGPQHAYQASARTLAHAVLNEVARLSKQGRVTLLIDGMEKVPEGTPGIELFDALNDLPEHVEQVVVVPWHATYGPHSETVIRPGEYWMIMRPDPAEGAEGEPTRAFLRDVVARRLSLDAALLAPGPSAARVASKAVGGDLPPDGFHALVDEAAVWSAGIPRIFLQLLSDAGTNARLRGGRAWPGPEDLADAVSDLEDSFRRALLPGDTEASLAAEGSDGRELDLDRKIRLLARGLLLERRDGKRIVLAIHPLARRALTEGRAHA
jgi:hypothetical protein